MRVASFWHGGPLSFFEIACIKSFIDAGVDYTLFVRESVENIPSGIEIIESKEIYDGDIETLGDERFNAGVYSDIFRAHLLKKTDYVWVDTDVVCINPSILENEYCFGANRRKKTINNCVLRLPKYSPALQLAINFYEAPVPIPHWWRKEKLKPLLNRYRAGDIPTLTSLPWTTTGPGILSWALRTTGEISRGQHWHRFYKYESALNHEFLQSDKPVEFYEDATTNMVHLYGSTKIHVRDHFGGIPPKSSYLALVCNRHGVDPRDFPIPAANTSDRPKPYTRSRRQTP
ncbi:hypothetical protein OE699_07970 [Sedimentimonas flavescens]|uniref:Alpha 1,4-glycosyltransferase n=1 Tax=Sedimentimonas flavescens TaxID=2851012 RepID=A0ABT2ZYQ4_9RHOB|nr:hypothetical protein [Sedimentimonas flavescens]MCV2878788.1 hypothetical protein [Sedimentimonas flavescens]